MRIRTLEELKARMHCKKNTIDINDLPIKLHRNNPKDWEIQPFTSLPEHIRKTPDVNLHEAQKLSKNNPTKE